MKDLQAKLLHLNESIDMIMEALEMGEDDQLIEQMKNLIEERDQLIKYMETIN